jgi:hypothetical protein
VREHRPRALIDFRESTRVKPTDQTGSRTRSVVLVVADERGTQISGIVRSVIHSSPRPLAAAYLRLLLDTHGAQS